MRHWFCQGHHHTQTPLSQLPSSPQPYLSLPIDNVLYRIQVLEMNRVPSSSPFPSQSVSQRNAAPSLMEYGGPVPSSSSSPPSMTGALLAPLNELQSLTQALFQALSSTQARPSQPPPISAFLAVDSALADATKLARKHQVKQRKIERLKNEVLELEMKWREVIQELDQGKRDLDAIIAEGDERIKSIEEAKSGEWAVSIRHFLGAPTHSYMKHRYRTPNCWPMRKVCRHSRLHPRTCQTRRSLVNLPRLSSSLLSQTKRRCEEVI